MALIGSANINDRSQIGSRDSEIAAVIEDTKTCASKMRGQPYEAKEFAFTLRKNVFKSIFGFKTDEEVEDPLNKDMWDIINRRTRVTFL